VIAPDGCGPNTFGCLGIVFSFRPRRGRAVWGPMLGLTVVLGSNAGIHRCLGSMARFKFSIAFLSAYILH
jgi:hypothetical protein